MTPLVAGSPQQQAHIDSVTVEQILKARMLDWAPDAREGLRGILGEWLIELVTELWHNENASGKRMFGMSSWRLDAYAVLALAGLVWGEFEAPELVLSDVDADTAYRLVMKGIRGLLSC